MTEQGIRDLLARVGALLTNDHFVYTSGKHGSAYVNKDRIYPHTVEISDLCYALAQAFRNDAIGAVVAPAIGGVILSQWTAHHLSEMLGRQVFAVYAEKTEGGFAITRGYDRFVTAARVLVVEDILTTGGSVRKVISATRAIGGEIVGVGALCNRGGITGEGLEVPKFRALFDLPLEVWDEESCPLCRQGVPINVTVGKGREFLARTGV